MGIAKVLMMTNEGSVSQHLFCIPEYNQGHTKGVSWGPPEDLRMAVFCTTTYMRL